MPAYLVQIDGYDPIASAPVTLHVASVDDERVCHLAGPYPAGAPGNGAATPPVWLPAIASLPSLRYDLFDGAFRGAISTPASSFELVADAWPNLPSYILADARVRIWQGEPGQTADSWTPLFDGRATAQPRIADGIAALPIAVDDRWLDAPLLATYAGTGGAAGEAALKGQPKPLAIGAPRFVPGLMIDAVNNVLQLSAYGAIEAVETAFERVVRFAAASGDHASYAALVAATIPAGTWATCKAEGLVRHGAPGDGKLAYHVKGDKAGADGWVRLPGAVIKRIAQIAGGSARVDEASVDALDAARPWTISLHQAEQTSARELIQRVAASVNAVAGVDWLSRLFVAPVTIGTPALTLDASGAALPPVAAVEQLEIEAPFHKLAIEAERTWDVHGLGDVSFTAVLVERGAYSATESYREGHIVQQAGSTWLYINTSPSTGNAPPTLPTTSNSWWRVLAAQGPQGPQGETGIQGPTGPSGSPTYVWIAYADSADGATNFTTGAPGARTYVGLAHNKSTSVESTNPADYSWSKIQGPQGDQGPQGNQGVQGPPGPNGEPTYTWFAYADSPDGTASFTTGAPGARRYVGIAPNKLTQVESNNAADYTWSLIQSPSPTDRTINPNHAFDLIAADGGAQHWSKLKGSATVVGSDVSARGPNVAILGPNTRFIGDPFSVTPGETLWLDYRVFTQAARPDGTSPRWFVGVWYYPGAVPSDPLTGLVEQYPALSNTALAAGLTSNFSAPVTVPAGMRTARLIVVFEDNQGANGTLGYVSHYGATRHEPASDVTKEIVGPSNGTVVANHDGSFSFGPPVKSASFTLVTGNGADITSTATWAATLKSGTATFTAMYMNDGKAQLDVNTLANSSEFEITAALNGVVVDRHVYRIQKDLNDPPPPPPASGSGTSANTSVSGYVSGSSRSAITTAMRVKAGSTGKIDVYITGSYACSDTNITDLEIGITIYARWRVVGGSYADFASDATPDTPASVTKWGDNAEGMFSLSASKTGLTNGTEYEVIFEAQMEASRNGHAFGGGASATGG